MSPVVAFLIWLACTLAAVVAGFVVGRLAGRDGREGIDLDALDQPRPSGRLVADPVHDGLLRVEWFLADGSTQTGTYTATADRPTP